MNSIAVFAAAATGNQAVSISQLVAAFASAYPGLFRYNRFMASLMVMGPTDWNGQTAVRRCTDIEILEMTVFAQNQGYIKATEDKVLAAVRHISHRDAYDPLVDYVLGLPAWDRVERWPLYCQRFLGHKADKTFARTWIAFACQMVARALYPGPDCKADLVPILWGKGGLHKSSMGLALCPDAEWFSGELPEDLSKDDTRLHLQGRWLIEMTEMRQFNSGRADTTKQFVSTCVDRFRMKYDKLESAFPRRCVFFASTNKTDMLQDETGNRRFVPIEVKSKIPVAQIAVERDQLWAEALWRYNDAIAHKQEWWLTDEEQEGLKEVRAAHEVRSAYDDKVDQFLREEAPDGFAVCFHAFTYDQLFQYLMPDESIVVINRERPSIGKALTRAGCEYRLVRGTSRRFWIPPEAASRLNLPEGSPAGVTAMLQTVLQDIIIPRNTSKGGIVNFP